MQILGSDMVISLSQVPVSIYSSVSQSVTYIRMSLGAYYMCRSQPFHKITESEPLGGESQEFRKLPGDAWAYLHLGTIRLILNSLRSRGISLFFSQKTSINPD